jgi:hypothetical protein
MPVVLLDKMTDNLPGFLLAVLRFTIPGGRSDPGHLHLFCAVF